MGAFIGFLLDNVQLLIGFALGVTVTLVAILYWARMSEFADDALSHAQATTINSPRYGPLRSEEIAITLLDAELGCTANHWHSQAQSIQRVRLEIKGMGSRQT